MKLKKKNKPHDGFFCRKTTSCVFKKINNSTYILSQSDQVVYELNEISGLIWELLERETTLEKIVKKITSKYQIDDKVAEKDAEDFLKRFIKRGLVLKISGKPVIK